MAIIVWIPSSDSTAEQEWLVNQIAHALRNPIFAALVQGEALGLKAGDDESISRSAHMIQKQLKRLEGNLEEMLLLGRSPKLNIRATDLVAVVEATVAAARRGMLGEPAEVGFDPESGAAGVASDPDAIRVILERLLHNAIQHTEPPHAVDVGIDRPTPDTIRLSVVDRGEGIADEIRDKIFLPFYPQHAGRPGLGLSVAAKFAHALGGHIEIETTPGEGTVAHCILPAVQTPNGS